MKRALLLTAAWSLCCGFLLAAEGRAIFEDDFKAKLGKGWTWLRENRAAWRIKDDALEIRVQPGVANTVKNALLRAASDRRRGSLQPGRRDEHS